MTQLFVFVLLSLAFLVDGDETGKEAINQAPKTVPQFFSIFVTSRLIYGVSR
jgi:hypothetical protein